MSDKVELLCPCCRAGLTTLGRLREYHERMEANLRYLNSLPDDAKAGLREMVDQGRKNRAKSKRRAKA